MTYNFKEKNIVVNSTFDLAATLAVPENRHGKMPAVVLISGTGKGNRDGSMPGFPMKIYEELSDFFANLGFAVIRYDKRGVGKSKGVQVETGVNDLVDDIIANVKYLESLDFVDKGRIILCGHSEGTILATITGSRYKVGGLILIAGAGKSMRTALKYQNRLVLQETKTMAGLKGLLFRKLINENNYLKNVNKLYDKCCGTDKDVIRVFGMKTAARWIREHNSYNDEKIVEMLKNAACPVLAITGDKDAQTDPEEINKLEELKLPHVTCRIVPGMDHILKRLTKEITILNAKKQYLSEVSQPIHEGLLNDIREWTVNTGMNQV